MVNRECFPDVHHCVVLCAVAVYSRHCSSWDLQECTDTSTQRLSRFLGLGARGLILRGMDVGALVMVAPTEEDEEDIEWGNAPSQQLSSLGHNLGSYLRGVGKGRLWAMPAAPANPSEGQVEIWSPTLENALNQCLENKWLEEIRQPQGGGLSYDITKKGQELLGNWQEGRLTAFAGCAKASSSAVPVSYSAVSEVLSEVFRNTLCSQSPATADAMLQDILKKMPNIHLDIDPSCLEKPPLESVDLESVDPEVVSALALFLLALKDYREFLTTQGLKKDRVWDTARSFTRVFLLVSDQLRRQAGINLELFSSFLDPHNKKHLGVYFSSDGITNALKQCVWLGWLEEPEYDRDYNYQVSSRGRAFLGRHGLSLRLRSHVEPEVSRELSWIEADGKRFIALFDPDLRALMHEQFQDAIKGSRDNAGAALYYKLRQVAKSARERACPVANYAIESRFV